MTGQQRDDLALVVFLSIIAAALITAAVLVVSNGGIS
jgi:hypothetical protein